MCAAVAEVFKRPWAPHGHGLVRVGSSQCWVHSGASRVGVTGRTGKREGVKMGGSAEPLGESPSRPVGTSELGAEAPFLNLRRTEALLCQAEWPCRDPTQPVPWKVPPPL